MEPSSVSISGLTGNHAKVPHNDWFARSHPPRRTQRHNNLKVKPSKSHTLVAFPRIGRLEVRTTQAAQARYVARVEFSTYDARHCARSFGHPAYRDPSLLSKFSESLEQWGAWQKRIWEASTQEVLSVFSLRRPCRAIVSCGEDSYTLS